MQELVETVCKSLVDNPEDVKVTQIDGEQTTILELGFISLILEK